MMAWEAMLGAPAGAFVVLTLLLFGPGAAATGRALARNWRPSWQSIPYAMLLALGDRFLLYALFDGQLLSLSGYVIAAALLLFFVAMAYRITLARLMVRQYPWLFQPAGLFGWRERS